MELGFTVYLYMCTQCIVYSMQGRFFFIMEYSKRLIVKSGMEKSWNLRNLNSSYPVDYWEDEVTLLLNLVNIM